MSLQFVWDDNKATTNVLSTRSHLKKLLQSLLIP